MSSDRIITNAVEDKSAQKNLLINEQSGIMERIRKLSLSETDIKESGKDGSDQTPGSTAENASSKPSSFCKLFGNKMPAKKSLSQMRLGT